MLFRWNGTDIIDKTVGVKGQENCICNKKFEFYSHFYDILGIAKFSLNLLLIRCVIPFIAYFLYFFEIILSVKIIFEKKTMEINK